MNKKITNIAEATGKRNSVIDIKSAKIVKDIIDEFTRELFCSSDGRCFLKYQEQIIEVGSSKLDSNIDLLYYEKTNRPLSRSKRVEIVALLEAKARSSGIVEEIYIRTAFVDDTAYIDLADQDRHVVAISASGYQVLNSSPICFVRPDGLKPLPKPLPVAGGLGWFKDNFRLDYKQALLLDAFIVRCFIPNGPAPKLDIVGPEGATKSTLSRLIQRLVDPGKENRSKPKSEEDIAIASSTCSLLAYDNLSSLSQELSDAFCRRATGGTYSKRKLYSNGEEYGIKFQGPTIITSRVELSTEPDLAQRTVLLRLEPLPDHERMLEADIFKSFEAEKAGLFTAYIELVQKVMSILPDLNIERLPRMADFARIGTAVAIAQGLPDDSFLKAFEENQALQQIGALEANCLADAIYRAVEDQESIQGNATSLLETLRDYADGELPTIRKFKSCLDEVKTLLAHQGIDVRLVDRSKREWQLTKLS